MERQFVESVVSVHCQEIGSEKQWSCRVELLLKDAQPVAAWKGPAADRPLHNPANVH